MGPYPQTLTLTDGDLSFATDLYQLTMAAAYHAQGELPSATFELTVRRMPRNRSFMVFAGLEQVLASLRELRFDRDQLDYLSGLPAFSKVKSSFFDALGRFRFQGDLWALPEGTIFFPQEPVLRVTGTLLEAQLVETLLLSIVNFQTTIASKAARLRIAAGPERGLAEFGSRRAHGPAAATWVARAAYLAGFDSTSNLFAGQRLGIPVVGTMAHSFVLSRKDEATAFAEYLDLFPDHAIQLVDTFDTLEGVRRAISLNRPFFGVRLDSGDLSTLSKEVRRMLDESGHEQAKIFASGDLQERRIAELLAEGAPIDSFGIGTELATSADAPALSGIYKLVEVERGGSSVPTWKASVSKSTFPGVKQILRTFADGVMQGDRVVLAASAKAKSRETALLRPMVQGGTLVVRDSLEAARARCIEALDLLPAALRGLDSSLQEPSAWVTISQEIEELRERPRLATVAD